MFHDTEAVRGRGVGRPWGRAHAGASARMNEAGAVASRCRHAATPPNVRRTPPRS